jgi:membrane protease YdiL (CAAX protease family)
VTPPGAPPHDVPQPYLLLMRARDWAWWRPVLGLLLFLVVYMVATVVFVVIAAVTGLAPDLAMAELTNPLVLLLTNASLVVAIPIVWLCWAAAHGLRIGWSSSVLGRLRWRLLWPYTLRALLTQGVAVLVAVAVTVLATGAEITGPDSSLPWLLLVVLLTTPLQSAAEEYFFRGYLSQAIAGWIGRPTAGAVVAALLTATLFSLVHLPPDFLTFLSRFAIGLAFSAVVWLTGGLEAAIVLHAVNNVVIFVLVGLLGDGVLDVTEASIGNPLVDWATVLFGIVAMGVFVAWVARSRRRLEPELLGPAVDLRGMASGPPWGMAPPWAPAAPWAPGPAGPPWTASAPPWAPSPWTAVGPQWGHPRPTWSPAPPPWVPPVPRSAPPPDDRWARPAVGPGQGPGLAGGPHGGPPGGPGAARDG